MARILLDRIVGVSGRVEAEIVLHTDPAPWNEVTDPDAPNARIPMIAFLQKARARPALRAAAGYDRTASPDGPSPGVPYWNLILPHIP